MKIAIVYNRESHDVINLFGLPNREKIGLKTIRRIRNALTDAGHQVLMLEGDKRLVERLEEFMPRVMKGERPGVVFNVSYGIQGQARYTHVPSILEMVGIPYVGSGPLAHSLALDKVVTKMILKQHGLPTPDFAVLQDPGFEMPDLPFPLIVKPKNEAVSFGIKVVHDEAELREAAGAIFEAFSQPVLAEQYIDGREINVGLLGNGPPQTLPPAELIFGEGPKIYSYEDKTHRSGRNVEVECPAKLDADLAARAQEIARKSFEALGCYDCARVDMRLDADGQIYVLEINSLPSMGEHGSYTQAAAAVGLDYPGLVNRLVDVACARYFGAPPLPDVGGKAGGAEEQLFSTIVARRDELERRLRDWVRISSRSSDPVGLAEASRRMSEKLGTLGLKPCSELTDERSAFTWQTKAGLAGGTLLVLHLDVPLDETSPATPFRRDAEWLYGEGVGARAAIVTVEYALQALRRLRRLNKLPLGVLCYTDEGRDARYSGAVIRKACADAGRVLVLRPGNRPDKVLLQRRGLRKYRFRVDGAPRRVGQGLRKPIPFQWFAKKVELMNQLVSSKDRLGLGLAEVKTQAYPTLLPHRITATLLMSYLSKAKADVLEQKIRTMLGKDGVTWTFELISDRPPMRERPNIRALADEFEQAAKRRDIPFDRDSSLWPSVGGLVPEEVPVLCGVGPMAVDVNRPQEAVQRISLVQRTVLLAEQLLGPARDGAGEGSG